MMPEIVLSDAPLLKAISGDLAALRQHVFGVLVVWVIVSALALGVAREFSILGIKIDITKVPASLGLLVFVLSVAWLCFAGYLTAEAIAGRKDRLQLLDLSRAVGANNVHVIAEFLDGGFGLDVNCAIDPARGAAFIGSNLCWSAAGAQTTGLFLLMLAGCVAVILTFRAINLKDGERHETMIFLAGSFCIIASAVALMYTGWVVFTSAEATILHELRRAAVTLR